MAKYTKKNYRRSKKHNKKRKSKRKSKGKKSTRKYKGGAGRGAVMLSMRPPASSTTQIVGALDKTMPSSHSSVNTGKLNLEIEERNEKPKWWHNLIPSSGTGSRGSAMQVERGRWDAIVANDDGNPLAEEEANENEEDSRLTYADAPRSTSRDSIDSLDESTIAQMKGDVPLCTENNSGSSRCLAACNGELWGEVNRHEFNKANNEDKLDLVPLGRIVGQKQKIKKCKRKNLI